jgi:hypothetical protein
MNDKIKKFISEALIEMIENKVSINLLRKNIIDMNGTYVNGFFDSKPLSFNCAMAKPQKEWTLIFLHEYNHYKQFKENTKEWNDFTKFGYKLWDWLDNKIELDSNELKETISSTRNLELDCEKRVVKTIEKYKLDCIDIKHYIKLSNVYILFYSLLPITRKWYSKAPYDIKSIVDTVTDSFLDNYDIVPKNFELEVVKNCF